jgi:hypothetical protein
MTQITIAKNFSWSARHPSVFPAQEARPLDPGQRGLDIIKPARDEARVIPFRLTTGVDDGLYLKC